MQVHYQSDARELDDHQLLHVRHQSRARDPTKARHKSRALA